MHRSLATWPPWPTPGVFWWLFLRAWLTRPWLIHGEQLWSTCWRPSSCFVVFVPFAERLNLASWGLADVVGVTSPQSTRFCFRRTGVAWSTNGMVSSTFQDDRLLLSSGIAPHGAIYGWDLASSERCFEHVPCWEVSKPVANLEASK